MYIDVNDQTQNYRKSCGLFLVIDLERESLSCNKDKSRFGQNFLKTITDIIHK